MTTLSDEVQAFLKLPEGGDMFDPTKWGPNKGAPSWQGLPYAREFEAMAGKTLYRHHVFAKADGRTRRGVVWSLVWGFQRGKMTGNDYSLKQAMSYLDLLVSAVDDAKRVTEDAADLLRDLNNQRDYLATAATTKVAYFARLNTKQGPALILDTRVLRALFMRNDPEFAALLASPVWANAERRSIGAKEPLARRIELALLEEDHYPSYLEQVHSVAAALGVASDDLERFLFVKGGELGQQVGITKRAAKRVASPSEIE